MQARCKPHPLLPAYPSSAPVVLHEPLHVKVMGIPCTCISCLAGSMQQGSTGYSGWTQGGMQGAVSMASILGPVSQQEQVLLIRESMMSLSGEQPSCCPLQAGPFSLAVWDRPDLYGTGQFAMV